MKTNRFLRSCLPVVFFFLAVAGLAQSPGWAVVNPTDPPAVGNELIVRFSDAVTVNPVTRGGKVITGLAGVDRFMRDHTVIRLEKVFEHADDRRAGKPLRLPGGVVINTPRLGNIYRMIAAPGTNLRDQAATIARDRDVAWAEPNYLVHKLDGPVNTHGGMYLPFTGSARATAATALQGPEGGAASPNDPLYPQQGWLTLINAPAAWDSTTGDTSQVIAILDTGVDWNHPDLAPNIWINPGEIPGNGLDDDVNGYVDDIRGWDFINNDGNPMDDNSHGTHVAGIAAARGNNATGIAGVAWNAKIMPVKMLQSSGTGTTAGLAAAIGYAASNGATVINMSLGYYTESFTVKAALENAYSTAVLVAAAGNDQYCICSDCDLCFTMFPAAYPFVLGVMAGGPGADFTNYDPSGPTAFTHGEQYNYEIAAPGAAILSTLPGGTYGSLTGTSMAAPMVAGAVALLKSHDPAQSTETLFCRLIQGAASGMLDISGSLDPPLIPVIFPLGITLHDTLPGANGNNLANAGETVNFTAIVQNSGGFADSVHLVMRLLNPSDTLYATITDSLAFLGDLSPYATIPSADPLVIAIDSATPHNRRIPVGFILSAANAPAVGYTDTITVFRTDLLHGFLDSTLVLTPDKRWIVYPFLYVMPGGKLIIKPGTDVDLTYAGLGCYNGGEIIGIGTPDSLITFYGPDAVTGHSVTISYARFLGARCQNVEDGLFHHCSFYDSALPFTGGLYRFYDCLFKNINFAGINCPGVVTRCNFVQCVGYVVGYWLGSPDVTHCNFSEMGTANNMPYLYQGNSIGFHSNNFLTAPGQRVFGPPQGLDVFNVLPQYWGTTDTVKIDEKIYDFWEDPGLALARYQPILDRPSDSAHGSVWKVLVNGHDPQDELTDPIGPGLLRFDVRFNRAMDTTVAPLLTFSAWPPYTHRMAGDAASWNQNADTWTTCFNVTPETGDGINTIRVSGARDPDGWEIPPEFNNRFRFVIQAASAASAPFMATPGLDRVDLAWGAPGTPDWFGFNLYRFAKNGNTLVADTLRINAVMLRDTLYTDSVLQAGPDYCYFYRSVGTDLMESHNSRIVTATPYAAAEGDANGDLAVNVLDITTIVARILDYHPWPFYQYAADVNDDDSVDVLDIIGILGMIAGDGGDGVKEGAVVQSQACLAAGEGEIVFDSRGDVAALQFDLHHPPGARAEPAGLPGGTSVTLRRGDTCTRAVICSPAGATLPAGPVTLLHYDRSSEPFVAARLLAGDARANRVSVYTCAPEAGLRLTLSPIPASGFVNIGWRIPGAGRLRLEILTLTGIPVALILDEAAPEGPGMIRWSCRDLPAGAYILRATARHDTGRSSSSSVRFIIDHTATR